MYIGEPELVVQKVTWMSSYVATPICSVVLEGAWLPCAEMVGVLVKVWGLLVSIKVAADYEIHERVVPAADLGTSPYPEWAHYHW